MSGVDVWNSQYGLHRGYLADDVRNRAFHDAIMQVVKPGMRVVDLGTGTGIWACVAAKAGASKVVAIEFSDLADVARQTARRNGVGDVVEVIQDDIRNVTLSRDYDVVIHELIGGFVWEEDMIELTAHAHDRFLAPGGVLVPGSIHVSLCPWTVPGDRPRRADWRAVCGVDVAHVYDAELAHWRAKRRASCVHGLPPDGKLAGATRVYTARLGTEREPMPRELRTTFVADRDGIATGLVAFMDIELAPGVRVPTAPWDPPTSWGQIYIPATEPLAVECGSRYTARVRPSVAMAGWEIDWHVDLPPRDFLH